MRDFFETIRRHSLHVSKYVVSLLCCFVFFASADYVAGKLFSRHRASAVPAAPGEGSAAGSPAEPVTATRGLASVAGKGQLPMQSYEPGSLDFVRPDERFSAQAGGAVPIMAEPGAEVSSAQGGTSPVLPGPTRNSQSAAATATAEDAENSLVVGGGYVAPATDTATSTSTTTSASLVWGTGTWGSSLWGP